MGTMSCTSLHTSDELRWVLRLDPVPRLNIDEAEPREELADQRQHLVGHVGALRPSYEQRRLPVPDLLGVLEREVAHVVERLGQDREGDAEGSRFGPGGEVEVA